MALKPSMRVSSVHTVRVPEAWALPAAPEELFDGVLLAEPQAVRAKTKPVAARASRRLLMWFSCSAGRLRHR